MALKINIITPGTNDKSHRDLIANYEKRVSRFAELNWRFVKSGDKNIENLNIQKVLAGERYIVLDENGKNLTTEEIAEQFSKQMQSGNPVFNIVVGGAYGLNDEIIDKADAVWAFGKITLPHQLVRLLLSEQIYRAMTIISNHPYHHK